MPASTFHEWVSARAYVRVRAALVVCIVVPVSATSYAHAAAPNVTPATAAPAAPESQAETRFAKGMALAASNDTTAAIDVFMRLTQDYPRLPEPHVQLAALYVKQGDHRKALAVLRSALALRTDEARIQAALGDLYTALAARAYRAAGEPAPAQRERSALQQIEQRTRATANGSP